MNLIFTFHEVLPFCWAMRIFVEHALLPVKYNTPVPMYTLHKRNNNLEFRPWDVPAPSSFGGWGVGRRRQVQDVLLHLHQIFLLPPAPICSKNLHRSSREQQKDAIIVIIIFVRHHRRTIISTRRRQRWWWPWQQRFWQEIESTTTSSTTSYKDSS